MQHRLSLLLESMDLHPVGIQRVVGGDINNSFRIELKDRGDLFVKINAPHRSKEIITAEFHGLQLMRKAGVECLPSGIRLAENETHACLVMEYYEPTDPIPSTNWASFFENLARMHLVTNEEFGGRDNFIGALPQVNTPRNNWVPFYRDNRLRPQFQKASDAGYLSANEMGMADRLLDKLSDLIPIERPSLVHGDLWGGNILGTKSHGVLMIDPCPYYGHREMDFAMMELFSGVPVRKYLPQYEELYPIVRGLYERLEIYQLYYLLVHLNMFGTAYLPGVQRLIRKFS